MRWRVRGGDVQWHWHSSWMELSNPLLALRHHRKVQCRRRLAGELQCATALAKHRTSTISSSTLACKPSLHVCHGRHLQLPHAHILNFCICHPGHHQQHQPPLASKHSPAKRSIITGPALALNCILVQSLISLLNTYFNRGVTGDSRRPSSRNHCLAAREKQWPQTVKMFTRRYAISANL
jgi:hypothetical protein